MVMEGRSRTSNARKPPSQALFAVVFALCGACSSVTEYGALVPPTADQDPALPRISIPLLGHTRWLHLETYGNPEDPVVFVLHGGPGSDFRLLLPLRALSDRYFIVMWDQHGGGLSERVPQSDLSIDSFDEEIATLHARYAPDRKIALIGHSFGGSIATRYMARHPDDVSQLILIEPGALTPYARDHRPSAFVGANVFASLFWDNEVITAQTHEQADYRLLGALRAGTQGYYCDGQSAEAYPLWRFGALALEIVPRNEAPVNYAEGIEPHDPPPVVIAGSCGGLNADFQRAFNLSAVPGATLETVAQAGHISLFLEYAGTTVDLVRRTLDGSR